DPRERPVPDGFGYGLDVLRVPLRPEFHEPFEQRPEDYPDLEWFGYSDNRGVSTGRDDDPEEVLLPFGQGLVSLPAIVVCVVEHP
ncbi:MAG: hypothetical protein ABIJ65_02500, partial [Chloroflexota bacterium]